MLNVTKELTALARKLGYTGKAPDTVAKAINAITSVASASGGGDGCDCYTVTKEQLLSETVETAYEQPVIPGTPAMAFLQYSDLIDMDTITVTFDGVDYTCTKHTEIEDDVVMYDYSLPDSPFAIVSILGGRSINERNIVYTLEGEGQHTVAITVDDVAPSANFQAAANNCLPNMPLKCAEGTLYDVMREATLRGQLMYFHTTSGFFFIADCPGPDSIFDNNELTIFPESNDVVAQIDFFDDANRLRITDANNPI